MVMRAEITKTGDITIVRLEGQINFEAIHLFRDQCVNKLKGSKVVFDLGHLNFVGSTGITSFFEIIKDVVEGNLLEPKFSNVKSEFQKLFQAWFADNVEVYEQTEHAIHAFVNPILKDPNRTITPIRVPNFKMDNENFQEVSSSEDEEESN